MRFVQVGPFWSEGRRNPQLGRVSAWSFSYMFSPTPTVKVYLFQTLFYLSILFMSVQGILLLSYSIS